MFIDFRFFGQFLAKKRLEAGLSQGALRKVLGYDSPQFISNWERGLCAPPLKALPDIARALNIPIEEIVEFLTDETENYLKLNLLPASNRKKKSQK